MAVRSYEIDGKIFWQVYIDLRGKRDTSVRAQKRVNGIKTEKEALAVEKKLLRTLTEQVVKREGQGLKWKDVIEKWSLDPEVNRSGRHRQSTIEDYRSLLLNWTKPWLDRVASEINRVDARELFNEIKNADKSAKFRKGLKTVIHIVYTWGLQERYIKSVEKTPVEGIEIAPDKTERRPEILTLDEVRKFLSVAKAENHKWYPIWFVALLTGCRSGELMQLRISDFEVISELNAAAEDLKPTSERRYGVLHVQRSWDVRFKVIKSTKSGKWRDVPVSRELYWFLVSELKIFEREPNQLLFGRIWQWEKGQQARILRLFCLGFNLKSVKFHTLRACFATQLIAANVPPGKVMSICGWVDLKTMQRYIRFAGIDVRGATEVLDFTTKNIKLMEKAAQIFGDGTE